MQNVQDYPVTEESESLQKIFVQIKFLAQYIHSYHLIFLGNFH